MDKHPLSMAAWAVDLQHDSSFRRWYKQPEMIGMSIAGMSIKEHADILAYCALHGAEHVTKKRRFEDFLHSSHLPGVMNLPDDVKDLTYWENEVVIVGHASMIDGALRWAKRYPPREHVVYVRDIKVKEIKRYVGHSNHRIVANTSEPGSYFVSSDDRESMFPLWLQG